MKKKDQEYIEEEKRLWDKVTGTIKKLKSDRYSEYVTSEDFSYMLQECPGAYILLGAGNPGPGKMLHNGKYDFNDDILTIGASYWSRLVEMQLNKN